MKLKTTNPSPLVGGGGILRNRRRGMMRKKELIENKVSIYLTKSIGSNYDTFYSGLESAYPVASNINVLCNVSTELLIGTIYEQKDYTFSKGLQKVECEVANGQTTDHGVYIPSGSSLASIISITPSSDDKYIYTF